jgi:hypothetical protein
MPVLRNVSLMIVIFVAMFMTLAPTKAQDPKLLAGKGLVCGDVRLYFPHNFPNGPPTVFGLPENRSFDIRLRQDDDGNYNITLKDKGHPTR